MAQGHARVFCCPSIYEPFGIINLEAMACETPVVASHVGGMKEIIVQGETGLTVRLAQQTESPFEATEPEAFAADLASALNELLLDPDRCEAMGRAGRTRVLEHFSWAEIAKTTLALYEKISK
ncbi:MAG: glycosyltransferase [Planctomycetota bacterium]